MEATESWCPLPVLPSAQAFIGGGYASVVITMEINVTSQATTLKSLLVEKHSWVSYSNVNILIIRSVRVDEWCLSF